MKRKESSTDPVRVVEVPVEEALRVERGLRLGEQELGRGELAKPVVEVVRRVTCKVVRRINSNK